MNKRVASDIIKKFDDLGTRDEALRLSDEHGYVLSVQIEGDTQTLVSVAEGDTVITAKGFEHPTEDAEPVEQAAVKSTPAPKAATPKK